MSPDSPRDLLAGALGAEGGQVVMERGYSFGFVGVHGQVRLIQLRASKKGFGADRAADDAAFAAFLEGLCARVERLLRERWGAIALRTAFDGEGELIARLYAAGPLERCDEVDPASTSGKLVQPGEQVDARELLVRASARPVENWGVFEMFPPPGDGGDEHALRCGRLVSGSAA